MSKNSINVTVSTGKPIRVNVSAPVNQQNVDVTRDTSAYNAELARQWAVAEGLVLSEDYSSKHYANKSKAHAQDSQIYAQEASNVYTNFVENVGTSINEVIETKDSAIADINSTKTTILNDIEFVADGEKQEIQELSEEAQNKIINLGIDTRANKDLSNLSEDGEKHFLNKSQITNCITEIPQRVKLELKDGVLTLKAGSEVIIPNGFEADGTTPKFDYVTIESDVIKSNLSGTQNVFLILNSSGAFSYYKTSQSGSTAPTTTYTLWYDTANNAVKATGATTDIHFTGCSLPLARITITNNVVTSIDQVFNGMGYIGSTVWVDKGVKGLIPNGRNEDGALRNIEYVTKNILMRTLESNIDGSINLQLLPDGTLSYSYEYLEQNIAPGTPNTGLLWFNTSENKMYRWISTTTDWSNAQNLTLIMFSWANVKNGVITALNPKKVFKALDYSSKVEICSWGMPSPKRIDLTLGASGSTYVAPANGYVVLLKNANAANQHMQISANGMFSAVTNGGYNSYNCKVWMPVKRGDTFGVSYTTGGTTNQFSFIYAEGER